MLSRKDILEKCVCVAFIDCFLGKPHKAFSIKLFKTISTNTKRYNKITTEQGFFSPSQVHSSAGRFGQTVFFFPGTEWQLFWHMALSDPSCWESSLQGLIPGSCFFLTLKCDVMLQSGVGIRWMDFFSPELNFPILFECQSWFRACFCSDSE